VTLEARVKRVDLLPQENLFGWNMAVMAVAEAATMENSGGKNFRSEACLQRT